MYYYYYHYYVYFVVGSQLLITLQLVNFYISQILTALSEKVGIQFIFVVGNCNINLTKVKLIDKLNYAFQLKFIKNTNLNNFIC